MRPLVFLLILANLFFFSWTEGYFSTSAEPDTLRIQQQLLANQVIIVTRDESPAILAKVEKIDKVAEKKIEKPEKPADSSLLPSKLPVAVMLKVERPIKKKFAALNGEHSMHNGSGSFLFFRYRAPGSEEES